MSRKHFKVFLHHIVFYPDKMPIFAVKIRMHVPLSVIGILKVKLRTWTVNINELHTLNALHVITMIYACALQATGSLLCSQWPGATRATFMVRRNQTCLYKYGRIKTIVRTCLCTLL